MILSFWPLFLLGAGRRRGHDCISNDGADSGEDAGFRVDVDFLCGLFRHAACEGGKANQQLQQVALWTHVRAGCKILAGREVDGIVISFFGKGATTKSRKYYILIMTGVNAGGSGLAQSASPKFRQVCVTDITECLGEVTPASKIEASKHAPDIIAQLIAEEKARLKAAGEKKEEKAALKRKREKSQNKENDDDSRAKRQRCPPKDPCAEQMAKTASLAQPLGARLQPRRRRRRA
jgi:hypothetical protein